MSTTPEEWLDLIIAKADKLRNAGVLSFDILECRVTLSPVEPQFVPSEQPHTTGQRDGLEHAELSNLMDPLSDPNTFGREEGENLPGYFKTRAGN